jgi:benzoyl-CoA reductase/2-hydroxyglutaryl-CoA dehydratase subunit BcrC/BadD/HgdB
MDSEEEIPRPPSPKQLPDDVYPNLFLSKFEEEYFNSIFDAFKENSEEYPGDYVTASKFKEIFTTTSLDVINIKKIWILSSKGEKVLSKHNFIVALKIYSLLKEHKFNEIDEEITKIQHLPQFSHKLIEGIYK